MAASKPTKRDILRASAVGLAAGVLPETAAARSIHRGMPFEQILSSGWQFRQAGDSDWLPATVPGTVHTDLLANGKIQDPFYRTNERDLQWIDKKDWEYRATLEIGADVLSQEHVELVFLGLDTYAEVYLNDALGARPSNRFF